MVTPTVPHLGCPKQSSACYRVDIVFRLLHLALDIVNRPVI